MFLLISLSFGWLAALILVPSAACFVIGAYYYKNNQKKNFITQIDDTITSIQNSHIYEALPADKKAIVDAFNQLKSTFK